MRRELFIIVFVFFFSLCANEIFAQASETLPDNQTQTGETDKNQTQTSTQSSGDLKRDEIIPDKPTINDENDSAGTEMIKRLRLEKLSKDNEELRDKVKKLERQVKKLTKPKITGELKFWSFEFNWDVSFLSGNTEEFLFKDGLRLKYDDLENWNFSLSTKHKFLMQGDVTKEHKGFGTVKTDYLPHNIFSVFLFSTHGWDESSKVEYHGDIGLGGKYEFLMYPEDAAKYKKSPGYRYSISAAILYEHEQFAQTAFRDPRDLARLSFRFKGEHHLYKNFVVKVVVFFKPNVEDFEDWSLSVSLKAKWELTKILAFRFGYEFEETTVVSPGVLKVDQTLSIGLSLKFDF